MYWKKKGCARSERKHLQAQSCQKADMREEAEETEIVTKRIAIQEAKKQRG
jgi:hypothetical protein